MSTSDLLLGLVVDGSGSMGDYGLIESTAEGVNALVRDQAVVDGQCLVSLTVFDTAFDVRCVGVDARKFPTLGGPDNPYRAGGGTALYDAVATTIKGLEAWLANHPGFDGAVKVAIFTDGQENSSREWHILNPRVSEDPWDLNGLIAWKQNEGWEILFLGAGGAAWTEANKFTSIPNAAVFNYAADAATSRNVYAGTSKSMTDSRVSGVTVAVAAASNDLLLGNAVNRGDEVPVIVPEDPKAKLERLRAERLARSQQLGKKKS